MFFNPAEFAESHLKFNNYYMVVINIKALLRHPVPMQTHFR